ncbi:unnamed protein product [Protopolystoma xenopodis]|uniref:RING-type domain-containing protein n=1 Tax=Protopolystoma xenopodis TaxID=117903 RepID=A0A448WV54_9PLAT|nr:unnamed protein product [Protopolystoma xenopodis]
MQVSVSDSSISTNNEDEDLFTQDSKKRKTIDDVPVKSVIIEEDSESCPICFEPWTSSGIHRLCCLKCGHLFGFECISKWLKAQGKVGKCPQCNSKAVKYDIRFLFCRNLKVSYFLC